ncbi:hypothetical protein HZC00_03625 [Candidatus Kaiserbacteria bacterium]|nr:hypothetical protein [Candidatus Kaiserbacteria bacterium]
MDIRTGILCDTVEPLVISSLDELQRYNVRDLRPKVRTRPPFISMCTPEGFQVKEVHNRFMEGNVEKVDTEKAFREWSALYRLASRYGRVVMMQGDSTCPDMVFKANAGYVDPYSDLAIMSNMVHESRRKETPLFKKWLEERYRVEYLPDTVRWEGGGDTIEDTNRPITWCGYGQRSEWAALPHVSRLLRQPVIALKLVSKLYHLDTCFIVLPGGFVLYCPAAFDAEGQAMIEWMFDSDHRIAVTLEEALTFVCNALAFGRYILFPAGAEFIASRVERCGFVPRFTPMKEMYKSGGSNACCGLKH